MPDLFPPFFDGTLREHYLLLFGMAGGIALVIGGMAAWVGAWAGGRRAVRRALDEAEVRGSVAIDARLEQMSQTVDLIALEVERIAEAQRFTARVLSDRQATTPPARRDPGVITPH